MDLHKLVLGNNEQAQIQQKKTCALQKGKQLFLSIQVGIDLIKMKKLGKKKSFTKSWERLYLFVGYVDEQENVGHDDGGRKCIIRGKDEQQWECLRRDL